MRSSVKALLSSVVDYAGLFPPAKLDMAEAMANYTRDQMSPYRWMLGRFVVPASRLNELEELLPTFPIEEGKIRQWSLSVVVSGDLESEIDRIRSRSVLTGDALPNKNPIAITALEFPPLAPAEIERVFPLLPAGVESFFEIPLDKDLEAYLSVLQQIGASAKIRTGGITVDAFPSVTQLCQCIYAFAQAGVPFKATAGLHHPLPGNHHLTSQSDSPSTVMHGFLNLVILAALVYWHKVTPEEALEILKELSINEFQFKEDAISWSNYQLNILEIEEARQRFFRSFGSCSFQEPIDDLKHLKLLS
jgi:hypothetical protein